MRIEELSLPSVIKLTPKRFGDDRGWFSETYNARALAEAGIDVGFVQDNQSFSARSGTVRGLHFQPPPVAQDKLVRVLSGRVFDVAVDIRAGSPTYGKWCGTELCAEEGTQLFIPKGFLHGFATLVPNCIIFYKCSDFYAPEIEGTVRFDDKHLGIDWRIDVDQAILSEKDAAAPAFADFETPFK